MKVVTGLATVVVIACLAQPAVAQPPFVPGGQQNGPTARPAVSPYLNLLRSSGSPGANLYGLVRPQQQTQAAIAGLRNQVNQSAYSQYSIDPNAIPVTGQQIGYMNHGSFFMNNGGNRGTGRPGAAAPQIGNGGQGAGMGNRGGINAAAIRSGGRQ